MKILRIEAAVLGLTMLLTGCSTVYPLNQVAKRTANPKLLKSDVTVDTSSRDLGSLQKVAWAAYSVDFDCINKCDYSVQERTQIAKELADTTFIAFDRELRKVFTGGRTVLDLDITTKSPAFVQEIKTDSYSSTIGNWLNRLNLSRKIETKATAANLKAVDPSELGWSGEESLANLGRQLGVDAVLVGHIRVTPADNAIGERRLVVTGPKIWLFSSSKPKALVVAGFKPRWSIDPASKSELTGVNDIASGFRARVSQALGE